MSIREYYYSLIDFFQSNMYETGVVLLAIVCLVSSFTMPIRSGGYVIIILVIILITVMVGSMFLLYNTTILALSAMFKEGLSDVETDWLNKRLRRNLMIVLIWFLSVFFSLFMPKDQLGTIASIYLISNLILFRVSGVDENPFLEKQQLV